MRRILARIALVGLLAGLASCGGGDGPTYTWFRALHAVPDAPNLRVSAADFVFREALSFGTATGERPESLLDQNGNSARITVEYFDWDGAAAGTVLELDVPVAKDSITTIVMAGSFSAPEAFAVVAPRRDRPLGQLFFQFAHADPGQGALDVYVTAPDTDLTSTAPLSTLDPLTYSESVEVPFGGTRIRLTQAGTLDVVLDSGELDFAESELATGPGAEWLFAVAPSVASGPSPVILVGSSGGSSVSIFDQSTAPLVRAVHGAAALDLVDFEVLTEPAQVLVNDLGFGQRSAAVAAPEGDLVFGFRAAATPDEPLASVSGVSRRGGQYLAALIDSEAGGIALFEQSRIRSVITEARLRIAHLSANGDLVSIHLTATEDEPLSADTRVIFNWPPGLVSPHFTIEPGQYFLSITTRPVDDPSNETDPVLVGPLAIDLSAGNVATLAVFPALVEGEPDTLQVYDDLLP